MDKREMQEIIDLWDDFKQRIEYENRFFTNHEVLDKVEKIAKRNILNLSQDFSLFRARIYHDKLDFYDYFMKLINQNTKGEEIAEKDPAVRLVDRMEFCDLKKRSESGFWGYDEKGSFVPDNVSCVNDGRANPAKIIYLYAGDCPYTAMAEVRPFIKNLVSIAEIKTLEELKIADFSYEGFRGTDDEDDFLLMIIMNEFSKPNNGNHFDYIPTQYISEFIKNLNMDGIKYNSSLYGRGRNYIIFNYKKCRAINSKLYKVNEVCLDADCIFPPLGEPDISHYMLRPYKEAKEKEMFENMQQK